MKNIVLFVFLSLVASTVFAGECSSSVCRQPVRNSVSVLRDAVVSVVRVPVNTARKVTNNVQTRRVSRHCR